MLGPLTEFLLARIAEREELTRAATAEWWRISGLIEELFEARRVLAECTAKRWIVELHMEDREHYCPNEGGGSDYYGYNFGCGDESESPQRCHTLRLLALPYVDHPDYQPEWNLS